MTRTPPNCKPKEFAVMLPFRASVGRWDVSDWVDIATNYRVGVALVICLFYYFSFGAADAQGQLASRQTILEVIVKWTPLLFAGPPNEFGGFLLNIFVSFVAMALGTMAGLFLGIGQISRLAFIRRVSWAITQLFRNSPWLVLLFYFLLLLPFQVEVFGEKYDVPGWWKATFALSLPIMANVSEIVRGSMLSVPTGQWESAESLAFSRHQTVWRIILPQCVKRMIPPWMNWYCILTMSTPLVSILGVNDGMTLTQDALAAEGRSEYLIPLYLWLMTWFFVYTYPIAVLTRRLENRFSVNQ